MKYRQHPLRHASCVRHGRRAKREPAIVLDGHRKAHYPSVQLYIHTTGAKVTGLVTLDCCVGLSLLLAIGVVLVQQRRDKEEEDVIIETGDNEKMVIREVYRETNV